MPCEVFGNAIICSSPFYEYEYKGKVYRFEIHSYFGPLPLRKDFEPRQNTPAGFYDMYEEFSGLSNEEREAHRAAIT